MAIGTDGPEGCWVQQAVRYRNNSFFLLYRKDRLWRSVELKRARTEAGITNSSSLIWRMSVDVIPSGGFSMYCLRSSSISGFINGNLLSERLYHYNSCGGTFSTRFGHCFLVKFFERNALMIVVELKKLHFIQ